jgi:hypothetical protein
MRSSSSTISGLSIRRTQVFSDHYSGHKRSGTISHQLWAGGVGEGGVVGERESARIGWVFSSGVLRDAKSRHTSLLAATVIVAEASLIAAELFCGKACRRTKHRAPYWDRIMPPGELLVKQPMMRVSAAASCRVLCVSKLPQALLSRCKKPRRYPVGRGTKHP